MKNQHGFDPIPVFIIFDQVVRPASIRKTQVV